MERIFIEKKKEVDARRKVLIDEFRNYLGIKNLEDLRIIDVYDLVGGTGKERELLVEELIFDPLTEKRNKTFELSKGEKAFRVESLKGQFDKREYFTNQIIDVMFESNIEVKASQIIGLKGIDSRGLETIRKYYINPIEKKEVPLDTFSYKSIEGNEEGIVSIDGFINFDEADLEDFKKKNGIVLDLDDLAFSRDYFKKENRDPSMAEIKLVDTYWSDHCRHTTFTTEIEKIEVEEGQYKHVFEKTIKDYLESRDYVYGEKKEKPVSLMDLGTINMKELEKKGKLDDKEKTSEINAASIEVEVDVDGRDEKWLLMFKNETHNHPTEMEPFGGAATCLGGAIRDPLSGRSYVYQAMRISGSGDPRVAFEETLKGKLSQRKISKTAMEGYSSYGNEIGASTGYVREVYDRGFLAKRLECGALVAAAPKENVYRGEAEAGDKIILVGGRTGRDGLGGAVGSSMEHSEDSLSKGGAEVQKGNPSLERKIIRLFRKKEVSSMIKVCNDFGAGGVGVAVGEIADGLVCELGKVPLKYEGLSPREILLSESQERMACLLQSKDVEDFLEAAGEEDLEAVVIGEVTGEKTLKFTYNGETVVKIKRSFLDTNGVGKKTEVKLLNPKDKPLQESGDEGKDLKTRVSNLLKDLNIASQKGLVENFDNTVSGGTVLMPLGGDYMLSPSEGMVSKLPVIEGETTTTSIMSAGYDPNISRWSPFHGGYFAVIDSIARTVAMGGSYEGIRLSFQEYFESLGKNKEKWGKPFLSLLGAYRVQKELDIASIGGKDSMSGTFEDIDVPPTLISFAVSTRSIENIISSEFKESGSKVMLLDLQKNKEGLLDLEDLMGKYKELHKLNKEGYILAASSVKNGGIIRSILEMSFGNKIGFEGKLLNEEDLFQTSYGSIVLEVKKDIDVEKLADFKFLGSTLDSEEIVVNSTNLSIDRLIKEWENPLEEVFPLIKNELVEEKKDFKVNGGKKSPVERDGKNLKDENGVKPKVLIPIFTGSHGEYTLDRSFTRAGGDVEQFVFKLSSKSEFEESIGKFKTKLRSSQILALPHGMSFSNEPGGGAKVLKHILSTPTIKEAIEEFLEGKDSLILGIGDGFNALLRLGIIGSGKGALVENKEGGFVSTMASMEVMDESSPWFSLMEAGGKYTAPIGSYEGRLFWDGDLGEDVKVASKFVGKNPTGSAGNIESLTAYNGRVLGTISSIDRLGNGLYKNIEVEGEMEIFRSAINYFKKG